MTWYEADYINMLPLTSMQFRPVDALGYPGRTYRFFNGSTLYPFGYGLSFTKFSYRLKSSSSGVHVKLDKFQKCRDLSYIKDCAKPRCPAVLIDELKCNQKIKFEVTVQNLGTRAGDEVVIVYSQPPKGIAGAPAKQVVSFERVSVGAKGSVTLKFSLDACKSLSIVDYNAYKVLPSGVHTIILGDSGVSFPIVVNLKRSN